MTLRLHRGFTLVEVLIVMVLVSAASLAIVAMQGSLFGTQAQIKDIQVGTGLMQECAERVLGVRRLMTDGYVDGVNTANFSAGSCGGMTSYDGNSVPDAVITDPYTGAGCPTNFTCKLVTVTRGGLSSITVMLVNY